MTRAELTAGLERVGTDSEGLAVVCRANETAGLQASRPGFVARTVAAEELDHATTLELALEPAEDDSPVIEVLGRKRRDAPTAISVEDAALVAPVGGDPAQVIRTLPGTQTYGLRPEVVVRGSPPGDSAYYIDDLEVPFLFHRIGLVSVLHDRALTDVELYRGGFGPQFGEATGGVVVLRTAPEPPAAPLTDVRVNLPAGAGLYREQPLGPPEADAGIAASVRRSYLDSFLPGLARDKYGLTLVPYAGDVYVAYTARQGEQVDKVTTLAAYDGLKLAFPSAAAAIRPASASFDVFTAFGLLGWERRGRLGSAGWTYRVVPQAAFTRTRSRLGDNRLHSDVQTTRIPLTLERRFDGGWATRLGFEAKRVVAKHDDAIPDQSAGSAQLAVLELPAASAHATLTETKLAGWTAIDVPVGSATLTPGLRLAQTLPTHAAAVDPRLALALPVGARHTLFAATGRYSQGPALVTASERYGNPRLGYEVSEHVVSGWSTRWSGAWSTELQTYVKRGRRIVEPDARERFANTGQLRSRGVEVFVRRQAPAGLFGWASYTYSRTEDRVAETAPFRPSQFDQTQVANLVLGARVAARWQGGLSVAYHTGDTYDRASAALYDPTTDRYAPRVLDEDRDARRLPDFHQADVSLSRDLLYQTWTLRLKLGVEFLSRQPQAIAVAYNADYSAVDYYVGPPAIPYIELRGTL